jgi:hypothetical protein
MGNGCRVGEGIIVSVGIAVGMGSVLVDVGMVTVEGKV